MKKSYIFIGIAILALVAGGVVTAYFINQQNNSSDMGSMAGMDHSKMSMTSESDTYKKYAALKGEAYDKEFVANMIVHHESAMNMAEMALASAKHQEIKDLAANINTSQGKEVGDMRNWQNQWGYPATSGHSMTGMEEAGHSMEGMADMNNALKGLSGDEFDKKFLELMIEHHQGAIDMAKPGATNAYHQEVKNLTAAIISAQTREIEQMKQWQKVWGYASNDSMDMMQGSN